jgi:hypothetical protein
MNDNRAKYQALRNAGKLTGTIEAAVRLRDKRAAAKPQKVSGKWKQNLRAKWVRSIPLGSNDRAAAYAIGRELRSHIRNFHDVSASIETNNGRGCTVIDRDAGRHGGPCTYRKIEHTIFVTSYGRTDGRVLTYRLFTTDKTIKAPFGYRWGYDSNGIKLYAIARPADDFHPDTADLAAGSKHCVEKLKRNAETRCKCVGETKHQIALIRKAEREGLSVCLADSLKAGNCRAGTIAWANRHGFSNGQHYKPSQLLADANGDTPRVALVVAVALRRHRREMEQGYAVLAEHLDPG